MYGQARDPHIPGPMAMESGLWESRGLSDVINTWLQKEGSHAAETTIRAPMSTEDPALKGPFYSPLFLRHQTLSTPPLVQQLKAGCKFSWNVKVFTQLHRAAAFVDEKVFLWNYLDGGDPVMYNATAVVTGVELIRPKPNVFASHVHYVLIVSTFSSVELVAVHVKDAALTEVCVQQLSDYCLSTNCVMQRIATFEGKDSDTSPRIFLGGSDGCVYELEYTTSQTFFQNKISLRNITIIAGDVPVLSGITYKVREGLASFMGFGAIKDLQVDPVRNYLYALDSKGQISLWWLGLDGETTLRQFQSCVSGVSKGVAPVSLHPISKQRASDHEAICVLMEDGSRMLYSVNSTHEGKRQLQPPRSSFGTDLGVCSIKALSTLSLQSKAVGPLSCGAASDVLQFGQIDESCRSCIGSKYSLLIPKNHQNAPQLICTASLDADAGQGNVLSVVDLKPLVRQAETWRQGAIPTVGINIFAVVEDEWAGSALQGSSSDLISQVIRPPPRFLVVHSAGITVLTRLRPTDLLHLSLLYPNQAGGQQYRQTAGLPAELGHLDADWLLSTYGKVEVSVMLLTLICNASRNDFAASTSQSGMTSGFSEEAISTALSSRPSQDVVQRAQEHFTKMGPAAHVALFQYFVRSSQKLWNTSFLAPFWEQLWGKKLFSLFVSPLEGLLQYLTVLVPPGTADLQHVWDPASDLIKPGSPVSALMSQYESFSDVYEMLGQPGTNKPDPDTLKAVEGLSRRGLLSIVQRTVEVLKILRALEGLSVEDRKKMVSNIKFMELSRVVTGAAAEEGESFTEALMGELLKLPHAVEQVWSAWRTCTSFFDPAAVDFYEARMRVLSPHSVGSPHLIQQALSQLQRPEVAPCLLRQQSGQPSTVPYRLEIICDDLCKSRHFLAAMQLACVAAKSCDPEQRAEFFHSTMAEPESASGDANSRAASSVFFNTRRVAYRVIINTLTLLCSQDEVNVVGGSAIRAQKAAAIEWALGSAAARYFEAGRGAKPVLAGELFGSTDKMLHFHLYSWLVMRPDVEGVWPSRCDLASVRPHRGPHQHGAGDSLQQFLSAGHFTYMLKQPLTSWSPQVVDQWRTLWGSWHVGLLRNLAEYCEMNDEHLFAACVRLALAYASSALLTASPDFSSHTQLLGARIDILVKAEASAKRGNTTTFGRQIEQWLSTHKPGAVAGVQQEMLRELPHEAWSQEMLVSEALEVAAAQDRAELQHELLPAQRLYEMLHDSYDEAVPHLAIKLLRIMGIDRPELKHIFNSTSNIGPYTVQDFVSKLIERHRRLVKRDDLGAIISCFSKLQDAAGIDQGIVQHTPPPFMPLQLVLSGLEEMALQICDQRGQSAVPEGSLLDPKSSPASVVPGEVATALNWPSSRVLYDGYRQLWMNIERGQTIDMFALFRGAQVEATATKRAMVARLMAILGQFCLQWLDRYEPDLSYQQSDCAVQQLRREYPILADDVAQMYGTAEAHPEIPANVRELIETCRRRLESFRAKIQSNQPSVPRREW